MSQDDTLRLLKEMGGEATSIEIREKAKKKYPKRALYMYISLRLKRLYERGIIDKIVVDKRVSWRIKKNKFP